MAGLQQYDWPGNIRELENLIERALILSPGPVLQLDPHMPVTEPAPTATAISAERQTDLDSVERDHIVRVLDQCDWKIQGTGNAAERLGLKPSTLRGRMKKLGIERS
jgi:DNA-binding NtrC family response regulator